MTADNTARGPRSSQAEGFTLTEVIMACMVLMLTLGALLYSFISAKKNTTVAQTYVIAMQIAQGEMERCQNQSYSNIMTVTNYPLSAFNTNRSYASLITNTPLQWGTYGRVVTPATNNEYLDITITISWMSPESSRLLVLTNQMTICNTN